MDYYVLDTNLNIVDVVDSYSSMIWTTRYYEAGDFELYTPANSRILQTIRKDYYVVKADDTTQAMIVKSIEVSTDVELGNYVIVTGKSLKSILSQRIIWTQSNLNGNVETCIRQLVTQNAISSSITARNIPYLVLGNTLGITDTMSAQYTGDNLEETISNICKAYRIGYDVLLDMDNKKFKFILLKGVDRSYAQDNNPYIVFSNDFENLLKTNYKSESTEYKNVALVAGEGEGTARKTAITGSATASGLNRYEIYVDARDISTNEGEITQTEYNKLLIERGQEKLSELVATESMEGEVEANYTYKVNEDYFLGDVVEVINEYGIEMTPQITEIIESEDENGINVIPTFSTVIE